MLPMLYVVDALGRAAVAAIRARRRNEIGGALVEGSAGAIDTPDPAN